MFIGLSKLGETFFGGDHARANDVSYYFFVCSNFKTAPDVFAGDFFVLNALNDPVQ